MAADTVTIPIPQPLYQRLQRLATLTHRPIESLVEQTLADGLPPLPDDVPTGYRDALVALETQTDAQLWHAVYATLPATTAAHLVTLRDRRRDAPLSATEEATLAALQHEAELLPLRKAYAAVLLKWRGHRLPTLAELPLPQ